VKLFRSIRLEQGRSLNNQLKAERGYRNPSFLQKMVDHHEIDQYGSGFPQEIFDPNGLHQEVSINALVVHTCQLACGVLLSICQLSVIQAYS